MSLKSLHNHSDIHKIDAYKAISIGVELKLAIVKVSSNSIMDFEDLGTVLYMDCEWLSRSRPRRLTAVCLKYAGGQAFEYDFRPGADFHNNIDSICKHLDEADTLVIHNGLGTDLVVLKENGVPLKTVDAWKAKTIDTCSKLDRNKHHNALEELLACNGLSLKVGSGREAEIWWSNGEYDRVVRYCSADVRLLEELFIKRHVRARVRGTEDVYKIFDLHKLNKGLATPKSSCESSSTLQRLDTLEAIVQSLIQKVEVLKAQVASS